MKNCIKIFLTFFTCAIITILGISFHAETDNKFTKNIPLEIYSKTSSNLPFAQNNVEKKYIFNYRSNREKLSTKNKQNGFGNSIGHHFIDKQITKFHFYLKDNNHLAEFKSHNISSYLKNEICTRAP